MTDKNELAVVNPTIIQSYSDAERAAQAMAKSGFFKDTSHAAQAIVKVLAGQELGFGPFASMTGVSIIQGKPTIGANLMAAAVKRTGKYNYRVIKLDNNECDLAFYENGQEVGHSKFTIQDATKAGLTGKGNWTKYPRNMLFARALSNGQRWYAPDVFNGALVYTPDELGAEVDEEGNAIDGEIVTEPSKPEPLPQRPYAPEILKDGFASKFAKMQGGVVSQGQRGVMVGKYNEILGGDTERYEVLEYLFGVRSAKDLEPAHVLTGLAHLNGDESMAKQELIAVRDYVRKEKGQQELMPVPQAPHYSDR
jgi:hypothetical protein